MHTKLPRLLLAAALAMLAFAASAQNNVAPTNAPQWRQCAQEGGVCAFNGSRKVAYGAGNSYITLHVDGGAYCNPRTFGRDPMPGVAKACYINVNEAMSPQRTPQGNWVKCGFEGQTCNVNGRRRIAFGNGNEWVFWEAEGSFPCRPGNQVDIARGRVRSCFYDAANQAQVPMPVGIPASWRRCGTEGQPCTLDRARQVSYGANGRYRTRMMSGTFICDFKTFGGDPYPGLAKGCYVGTE